MLVLQGIWDQLTIDSISDGLVRLWYMLEESARSIGPGTLLLAALVGGALYYMVVRPR